MVLAIFITFLLLCSPLPRWFSSEATPPRRPPESEVLDWLRNRTSSTDDPTPHSTTLPHHLRRLDDAFRDAYTQPELKGRTYDPTVYPAALSPYQIGRYAHLRSPSSSAKYLLGSSLFNVAHLTPDLFLAIVVVADFLGPSRIGLSIVEGPSNDGSDILLETVLSPVLLEMGISPLDMHINTRRVGVKFGEANRIAVLARLREEVMLPIWRAAKGNQSEYETTVFLNDVYVSGAGILELIHQHVTQESDMTCAWDLLWQNDYFYDTWVARDIHTGDLFHAMGTSWSPSSDIFPTSPSTRARASSMLPFQAAACWNGIALLRTSSLLPITDANPPHAFFPTIDTSATHFRRSRPEEGECAQAEVSLICKDLWRKGRGRILVVPGVRLAYERHVAVNSRDAVGASGVAYGTSAWGLQEQVAWLPQPPPKIRCHPWPEQIGLKASDGSDFNIWAEARWVNSLTG